MMIALRRPAAALLLLAALMSGLEAAGGGGAPGLAGTCATAAEPSPAGVRHAHSAAPRGPAPAISSVGGHECPHCDFRRCSGALHCVTAGAPALLPDPQILAASAPIAPAYDLAADHALSANPTPPIPPPQPVL